MKTLTTLLALAFLASAAVAQTTDDQIAQAFVPPAFDTFASQNPGLRNDVSWMTIRLDLDHTGRQDYVAIAYGNTHIGVLRVVRTTTTPALAGESSAVSCDLSPRLSAVDLDGDGVPELSLECTYGNHGTPFTSFFAWNSGLHALNPPHPRRSNSWWPIENANLVDLDGTGTLVVLEPGMDASDTGQQWNVYRLKSGHLVKSGDAPAFFDRFYRDAGAPEAEEQSFSAPPGTYTMTVINGLRGQHMVSSALVTLNGQSVLSPDLFSQNARLLSADVTLTTQNTITVSLRSVPTSFVDIVITPKH